MNKSTSLNALLAGFASIILVCAPTPALAQHGGGGHGGGGGGGSHGGGGSFSGGSSHAGGTSHGGGYSGYHGGSFAGARGASAAGSAARGAATSRAWSFDRGGSVRDTSPGFHSFGGTRGSAEAFGAHGAAIADGQFHSFAGVNGAFRGGFRGGFFGYPGFGWGWGLGYGWGFGWGWNPYWAWPYWYNPYWYNPWWGDSASAPDSFYPY